MSKRDPTPRDGAYQLYWYFASERHRVFECRVKGMSYPWTGDNIINKYKFCCVFRAADRVSQYMIRDVVYNDHVDNPEDRLFQIVMFRTFSRISTWESILKYLGRPPSIENLADGSLLNALEHAKEVNGGLYTSAFILCANDAYGRKLKHLNHVELFMHMFVYEKMGEKLLEAKSLQRVYAILHEYPLMGDFMSYQTAIDLNYSEYINFSENDFTQPGPGAVRGLKKVFIDLGDYTPDEIISWMVENQESQFMKYSLPPASLWGRRLHAIDCQGLFCETDKYCREALPGLTSERTRIKAKYTQSDTSINLYFPPKWKINHLISKEPVFASTEKMSPDENWWEPK